MCRDRKRQGIRRSEEREHKVQLRPQKGGADGDESEESRDFGFLECSKNNKRMLS